MSLHIRLYGIDSENDFIVSYKSGDTLNSETTGFTVYDSYEAGTTGVTISGVTFLYGTNYWVKIQDTITNRYIIENIVTHDDCYFGCYDKTPTPTATPTPTSTPSFGVNSATICIGDGVANACLCNRTAIVYFVGTLKEGVTLYSTSGLTSMYFDGLYPNINYQNKLYKYPLGGGPLIADGICVTPTPTPTPLPPTPTPTPTPLGLYIASSTSNACNKTSGTALPTFAYTGTQTLCSCIAISGANISGLPLGTYYISDGINVRQFSKTVLGATMNAIGVCSPCIISTPTPTPPLCNSVVSVFTSSGSGQYETPYIFATVTLQNNVTADTTIGVEVTTDLGVIGCSVVILANTNYGEIYNYIQGSAVPTISSYCISYVSGDSNILCTGFECEGFNCPCNVPTPTPTPTSPTSTPTPTPTPVGYCVELTNVDSFSAIDVSYISPSGNNVCTLIPPASMITVCVKYDQIFNVQAYTDGNGTCSGSNQNDIVVINPLATGCTNNGDCNALP